MVLDSSLLPGSIFLFATVLLGLFLSFFVLRQREEKPGAITFAILMLAASWWAATNAFEYLSLDPRTKIFWAQVAYFGSISVPVLWLLFTLRYSREDRLLRHKRMMTSLWIIPILTWVIALTNDRHHLLWSRISPIPGANFLLYEHGIWFYVMAIYGYILVLGGSMVLLYTSLVRYPLPYRRQVVALVVGSILPWLANLMYLLPSNPFPGFDLTPFAFSLSGIFYSWALFRFKLLEIVPMARDLLVESMSDGILVLGQQAQVMDFNPAALRMLGLTASTLIGKKASEIFSIPESAFTFKVAGNKGVPEGPTQRQMELKIEVGASSLVLDLMLSSVYDTHSRQSGCLVLMRDITERKCMEEELRTTRDAAEAASRYKSEFLANMSHEIRTPMNAVIGMTTLLLDTPMNEEQRDWLEIIRNSGEALLGIINDILDYSRIESGKLLLEQHEFSLRSCIEESLDVVSMLAAEKKLELLYEIDDNVPDLIVGDSMRLRQILVNLLNNAVKFTPSGEVLLSVKSGGTVNLEKAQNPNDPNWTEILFTIKDTGIGIPQDRLDLLFQPFSQVDASITRRYGGSGLGLAICRRLVEMMGGRVWAESMVGQGSTFSFTIWSLVVDEVTTVNYSPPPGLARKRMMIVDENITSLRILSGLAQKVGMKVRTARSLSDIMLQERDHSRRLMSIFDNKGISGQPDDDIDVLVVDRRIKDLDTLLERFHNIPIVLMAAPSKSGYTGKLENMTRLFKPVRPSRFYRALAHCFQLEKVGDAVQAQGEGDVSPESWSRGTQYESQSPFPPQQKGNETTSSFRILLAEDNPTNQKVIQLVLRQLGYQADLAEDGFQVLDALNNKDYDLVLMDVQMPRMDGLEASRAIRKIYPAERQPYIIAMTANAMSGDRELCLDAGMDDYLSKPVRIEELSVALLRRQQVQTKGPQVIPSEPLLTLDGVRPDSGLQEATRESQKEGVELSQEESSPVNAGVVIDRSVIDTIVTFLGPQGNQAIEEVAVLFRQNIPDLIAQLDRSLILLDLQTMRRLAHSIKSSSVSLGAVLLSDEARKLEEHTRELAAAEDPITQKMAVISPEVAVELANQVEKIRVEYMRASDELTKEGF